MDCILDLLSDKMTAFLANDILTLTFYCIFACLHSGILVSLHASIPEYLFACLIAYLHVCIRAYLHTYILVYFHSCLPEYLFTCILAYLHSRKLTDLHTCIHAMHTHNISLRYYEITNIRYRIRYRILDNI